ncbi:hypothetical protein [Caballeronia telluris]|uniref:Uncharacterized protein n=1 Tax=Caballeronia telluris TaxID=326475 RepID=A0A158G014_9BURK|nr:hypothetical protein [Caballeronia telluris]SAL25434.1 hypothetical protein AWB66_01456 [Caballeronia telluris]
MCYGNPEELLVTILPDPLPRNKYGHTVLEDFDHFCAFSGLSVQHAGQIAFDWAKAAFVSASLSRNEKEASIAPSL